MDNDMTMIYRTKQRKQNKQVTKATRELIKHGF